MSYIEIRNATKAFGENTILKGISLSVEEGELLTFLGPSGCGKTTLLRCLVGLESLDQGQIFLEGRDITALPANKREMVMIFQRYALFPTMNVFNNVSFALRMQSIGREEIRKRVKNALEMVDLIGHEKKFPYQLSGGEQQRVSLARSLIVNPKVLLLDEPFSAIDAKLRKELQIRLKQIHKELGMTSIFVTHDQEEAMRISDTIHLFNKGTIAQSGKPQTIYAQPSTTFVASFIGNYNQLESDAFNQAAGSSFEQGATIVIRPEVIRLSPIPPAPDEGVYLLKGRIKELIPQGSFVRYYVQTAEFEVMIDLVFNYEHDWVLGQEVFAAIDGRDIRVI